MNLTKKIISFLTFILLVSCTSSVREPASLERMNFEFQSIKLDVPQKLWEGMLSRVKNKALIKSKHELFEGLPLQVKMFSKERGVLVERGYHLTLNEWGGDIDVSQFLGNKPGEFYLKFVGEDSILNDVKVYYLSNFQKREIAGEEVGAGCGFFADVTEVFKDKVFENGVKVHSGYKRFLNSVGGRYYFVIENENQIKISQVTILDSTKKELQCKEQG